MGWWVDIATSGFAGLVVALLIAAVALAVVVGVLAGLLHATGFVKESFVTGWRRGWDRDAGDLPAQQPGQPGVE